jgi:D-alanyl-D-alanine carboxypeptidase/D-alanyl-D-alanine carboxypeptidase (penicillin-binding protein 5/6)
MPFYKKNKKISLRIAVFTAALLLCLQLISLPVFAEGGSAPSISARSAILIEAESGIVVFEKNADEVRPMASTTKIMTALVALESGDVQRTVQVSAGAIGIEGSSVYLYKDEKLTLEDLIYAMMLESANDAAAAIAIEVGGSIEGFADMMNKKAEDLGLRNTHFENPHGLDGDTHYTTARELAKITRAAMKNEDFRAIVSTFKKTIPLNESEGVRLLINHNKMLKGYDGAIGVKTGFTKKSGRCLVSAAERDGVELICVTLNAPDDWSDHRALLNYGFSLYESRILCRKDDFKYIQPVIGGLEEYVMLEISDDVTVTVPRGCGDIEQTIELPRFSYAQIKKGDKIGHLVYTADGQEIARVPIIASYSVDRIKYKKTLWERITSLFLR